MISGEEKTLAEFQKDFRSELFSCHSLFLAYNSELCGKLL